MYILHKEDDEQDSCSRGRACCRRWCSEARLGVAHYREGGRRGARSGDSVGRTSFRCGPTSLLGIGVWVREGAGKRHFEMFRWSSFYGAMMRERRRNLAKARVELQVGTLGTTTKEAETKPSSPPHQKKKIELSRAARIDSDVCRQWSPRGIVLVVWWVCGGVGECM